MDCKQYQQYALADSQDENSKKTREWIEVRVKGWVCHLIWTMNLSFLACNNHNPRTWSKKERRSTAPAARSQLCAHSADMLT